jgi:hypothetical protein
MAIQCISVVILMETVGAGRQLGLLQFPVLDFSSFGGLLLMPY